MLAKFSLKKKKIPFLFWTRVSSTRRRGSSSPARRPSFPSGGRFEGVSVTTVILATVRGEGRLRAAGRYVVSGESGEPGESGGKQKLTPNCAKCVFLQQKLLGPHSGAMFFFYFSIPHSSNTHSFESFGEDCLPEMLSKLGVLAERGMKKSTKTSRDSSGGLGGCGGLGQLWEALAELWDPTLDPTLFSNVKSSQRSILKCSKLHVVDDQKKHKITHNHIHVKKYASLTSQFSKLTNVQFV